MDSMKNLIVKSSRLAMVESLLLHPGSTTASRNIKKWYVVTSSQWEACSCAQLPHSLLGYDVKNALVVVASCDTRCKKYFTSLANDNKIVRSSRYDVHWFALRNTTWSLLACWRMRYDEKIVLLLFAHRQHKKGCRASSSLVMLVARILTMWQKQYRCRCFLRYNKNMLLRAMA